MVKTKVYHDRDADLSCLEGRRVAVIGFGSQGKAQAFNLRDSGIEVVIGLSSSRSRKRARKDGFECFSVSKAVMVGDIISFLFPDQKHKEVFDNDVAPNLFPGKTLLFAHGLSVHFGLVKPPDLCDVIMVAPHGPGTLLRQRYIKKKGVACFIGVHSDCSGNAKETALAYAHAIGCTRSGAFETSFEDEAVGDILGEQVALCGGLTELLEAAFETLVIGGLSPENAYLECVQQLDLIVDLIKRHGISGMYRRISHVAEYGSYLNKNRIINEKSRRAMRAVFEEIKKGEFTDKLMKDYNKGFPDYQKRKKKQTEHPINKVGALIRGKIKD
ncbi:MAG: ketol-acid reductoisomerase [candidate division Zixibacteria bacterium]|nr:ketol-acid reductoisomerase [candidate division Zixibacteria bacterium]